MPDIKKKFNVIVMNPPYQGAAKESEGGKGSRNSSIWPECVNLSISLAVENGYIVAVHPPRWRKPEDEMFAIMSEQNITYLEMHSKKDGIKSFGAMTPYDWYIMQKKKYQGKTEIKTFDGKRETINLLSFPFLPHFDLENVSKLIAKAGEKKCEVLYDSTYHTQKPHMNETKTEKFCYPCVHSTVKNGIRYWFSSKKEKFFGIPKIIFGDNGGDTGIVNLVVDNNGECGITQHSIGIPISSKEEGEQMKKALESEAFKKIINACQYGGFQIDWRMFRHFRKDFWKEFLK